MPGGDIGAGRCESVIRSCGFESRLWRKLQRIRFQPMSAPPFVTRGKTIVPTGIDQLLKERTAAAAA
jgi:hypothetical protein